MEKYLTYEQIMSYGRIFLNTVGLILEDAREVNESSKLKIYNEDMNEVGTLYFNNGKVIISAEYNDSLLKASYDIPQDCFSEINYEVQNSNSIIKISGIFSIESYSNYNLGIICLCHHRINCEFPGKGNIVVEINSSGRPFGFKIELKNYHEELCIMPNDEIHGFIHHDIEARTDDSSKTFYRRYFGIIKSKEEDNLHVLFQKTKNGEIIKEIDEMIHSDSADFSSMDRVQKGILMQKIDPEIIVKICELRALLKIGNVRMLDNLISISYDNYSDEELKALLGVDRKQMKYQNGASNLTEAYFGKDKDNQLKKVLSSFIGKY